jgi:hypothetical protein
MSTSAATRHVASRLSTWLTRLTATPHELEQPTRVGLMDDGQLLLIDSRNGATFISVETAERIRTTLNNARDLAARQGR